MHLAWVPNLVDYLKELQQSNLHVFANTVSPEEFLFLKERLASIECELNDLYNNSAFACETPNLKIMSDFRGEALCGGWLQHESQGKNLQSKSDLDLKNSAPDQAKDDLKIMSDLNFKSFSNVKIGVGAHPWYSQNFKSDLFCKCLEETQFVGEIGLDFSKRFSESEKESQIEVFKTVCSAVASAPFEHTHNQNLDSYGAHFESATPNKAHPQNEIVHKSPNQSATTQNLPCQPTDVLSPDANLVNSALEFCNNLRIISVHSCKTNGLTHEILKRSGCLENCIVIYHWFNDDFETLKRCKKDGCLFSVNPRMLATKNGAEIARQIGSEHLLFETDFPRKEGETLAVADELEAIIQLWEKLIKTENAM